MKQLLFISVIFLVALPLEAQSIRAKRVKKLPIKHEAFYPSFGSKSHELLLSERNREVASRFNTRTRKERTVSALPETDVTEGSRVKVSGTHIQLFTGEADTSIIAPMGEVYYIWASLSPDQQQLLFTAPGQGTYVSDLDGQIIAELGYINAPTWLNNQWVLGMDDQDDGHQIQSSDVIAVHVPTGTRETLTAATSEIALYPKASDAANRIAFHNLKGEIFTIRIRIKE